MKCFGVPDTTIEYRPMSGNCAGECALRDDLQNADERNEKANNIIMAIAYGTPTNKI